jgi:hypothetical protein
MKNLRLSLFLFLVVIACKKDEPQIPAFIDTAVGIYNVTNWEVRTKNSLSVRTGKDGGKVIVKKDGNFLSIVALPLGENNDWYTFPKCTYIDDAVHVPGFILYLSSNAITPNGYIIADLSTVDYKNDARVLIQIYYTDSNGTAYEVSADKYGK